MKITYFIASFFLLLISSLLYNISEDNKKVNNYFNFDRNISDIVIVDNNFDKFITSEIGFMNFDFINNEIRKVNFNISKIEEANLFDNMNNINLENEFKEITVLLKKKMEIIERLKSYNAILNNSFRNSARIITRIKDSNYLNIFIKVISLNYQTPSAIKELKEQITKLTPKTHDEKLFLLHSKLILKKLEEHHLLKLDASKIAFGKELEKFERNYSNHTKELITNIKNIILALLLLLSIFIFLFLYYSHNILKSQLELKRFKNAVDDSTNFIVVTDRDKKIKYINKSIASRLGCKLEDVKGQNPAIFSSGFIPKDAYKEMNEAIYSGRRWNGEFINRAKDDSLIYEKASITPIFNEEGKIEEFLAIKSDITKEKEILKKLKEKDHKLTQQAKMVIMNDILNSIAHQWRQPLSVISTAASGLIIHKDYGTLNDETFKELTESIMDNSQYLSQTIDNFKSFFKTGNEITIFNINDTIDKAYKLIEFRVKNNDINYIINSKEEVITLKGIENDLIQVFVTILNNSLDALENSIGNAKFIFVDITKNEKSVIIKIKDNARGIGEKDMSKVFQPYFTTKHKSQGTGMGLYMSHQIITEQFKGKISLSNRRYEEQSISYKGVECVITIPLVQDNLEDVRPTM